MSECERIPAITCRCGASSSDERRSVPSAPRGLLTTRTLARALTQLTICQYLASSFVPRENLEFWDHLFEFRHTVTESGIFTTPIVRYIPRLISSGTVFARFLDTENVIQVIFRQRKLHLYSAQRAQKKVGKKA